MTQDQAVYSTGDSSDDVAELRSALSEKDQLIHSLQDKLESYQEALKSIAEFAQAEQGEWNSVEVPYAPAWVSSYRAIEDIATKALEGEG